MSHEWRVLFSEESKASRPALSHLLAVPEGNNSPTMMQLTSRLCAPHLVVNFTLSVAPTTHGQCKNCARLSKQVTQLTAREWRFAT